MSDEQLPVSLSKGVQDVLAENETSLEEILRREGLDVSTRLGSAENATGTKDAVLILIASSIVIAAATPILTRALEIMSNKPVKVTKHRLKAGGLGLTVEFESEG